MVDPDMIGQIPCEKPCSDILSSLPLPDVRLVFVGSVPLGNTFHAHPFP